MILTKSKPPTTQRKFADPWLELDYLCKKIHFWFYTRGKRPRAERYLDRLEQVLNEVPRNNLAIIRHEGLALLHVLKGELSKAIHSRTREIELIERLHEIARSPKVEESVRAYMLQGHEAADLQVRRKILQKMKSEKLGRVSNGRPKPH